MEVYENLNRAFNQITKILFGEEAGELKDFMPWLREYSSPLIKKKSSFSKLPLVLPHKFYSEKAKFVSYNELNMAADFPPLSINEIKDIDSIIEALKERFVYAGSIILGNSSLIKDSTNIIDSYFVLESSFITSSKYICCSSYQAYGNYIFGSSFGGPNDYVLKSFKGGSNNRIFETYYTEGASDSYYCANVDGSREIMFSFNQIGKSYVIGNIVLSRERYYTIKSSLIEQLKEILLKNKELPSLSDLLSSPPASVNLEYVENEPDQNIKEKINDAFNKTSKIVLSKELGEIDDYSSFLWKHVPFSVKDVHSTLSRTPVTLSNVEVLLGNKSLSSERVISLKEAYKISSRLCLDLDLIEQASLDKIARDLGKIAIFYPSIEKDSVNCVKTDVMIRSYDTYMVARAVNSRLSAYSHWPRDSQYIFGSSNVISSSFSINTYDSSKLSRAFEVDSSRSSSDVYFCHNVENVINGMFSFNIKNKSYIIGNAVYSPSVFSKIKSSLLEQISSELIDKKYLNYSIFDLMNH